MNKLIKQISLLIISIIISLSIGCKKNDLDGYNYVIERHSSSSNLIFFEYLSKIYGLDTGTNTVEVLISIKNMEIGGVAKLPSGGVAITSRGNTNNHLGSGKMYITDNNYNVIKTVNICSSPMDPKVVDNIIIIGSSSTPSNVVVVRLSDFKVMKTLIIDDMVEATRIANHNDAVYFGTAKHFENGSLVKLDLNTLDTSVYTNRQDFFNDGFAVFASDTILYIFGILKHQLLSFNYNNYSFTNTINFENYPEYAALKATNLLLPMKKGDYLYGCGFISQYPNNIMYFMKFNLLTNSFEFTKRTIIPSGYITNAGMLLIKNKLYIKSTDKVITIDYLSGNILNSVQLK